MCIIWRILVNEMSGEVESLELWEPFDIFSASSKVSFCVGQESHFFPEERQERREFCPLLCVWQCVFEASKGRITCPCPPALAGECDESYNLAHNLAGYCLPWIYVDTGGAWRGQAFMGNTCFHFFCLHYRWVWHMWGGALGYICKISEVKSVEH